MSNIGKEMKIFSKLFNRYLSKKLPQYSKTNNYGTLITKLMYSEFGDPTQVIHKVKDQVQTLKPGEILVKMLASPINPADINTIQGRYPSLPKLPAVAGNEGVGEVVDVGPDVQTAEIGDRVIPLTNNSGTWRTHITLSEDVVYKVPKDLGVIEAATLKVNPCTAYRMLGDFVKLIPGDTVIQNGANSACGQYVVQLCHAWNINTVNIVRDRSNIGELKDSLMELGASHVLTEEELRKTTLFKDKVLPKPRLALNCVGGKNALEVLRHLDTGGHMVTYGGMSREPVTIPTSALIFKDVKVVGYWMTRWGLQNIDSTAQKDMFHELIKLMSQRKLRGPVCEMVDPNEFKEAIASTMDVKGKTGKKYILQYT